MKTLKRAWLIPLLVLSAFGMASIGAQSITGTYQTEFGNMTLRQTGAMVSGSFGEGSGIVAGILSRTILTGWWFEDSRKGKIRFEFDPSFSAFEGVWGVGDSAPQSGWNGIRIVDFRQEPAQQTHSSQSEKSDAATAIFTTDFGSMSVIQIGNSIMGTYDYSDGRIEGTLTGRILTGRWTQSNGEGRIRFEFSADFSSFTGLWGYNDAEPTGTWNGTLNSGALAGAVRGTDQNAGSGERGSKGGSGTLLGSAGSGASAGQRLQDTVFSTDFGTLSLSQSGNSVSGTYDYSDGRIEGTLTGRILTGRWTQSNGEGRIRFEFSADFSSFTGLWGYNDAEPTGIWNGVRQEHQ